MTEKKNKIIIFIIAYDGKVENLFEINTNPIFS